jgi:hypothetical protein
VVQLPWAAEAKGGKMNILSEKMIFSTLQVLNY